METVIKQRKPRSLSVTAREREVLTLAADGLSIKETATQLNLSTYTVDTYVRKLMNKLKARNMKHVIALSFRMGYIK